MCTLYRGLFETGRRARLDPVEKAIRAVEEAGMSKKQKKRRSSQRRLREKEAASKVEPKRKGRAGVQAKGQKKYKEGYNEQYVHVWQGGAPQ